MERFKHYGQEVVYQFLEEGSFIDHLEKNGVEYTELPIMEDRVVCYAIDGRKKYAYMTGAAFRSVYITEEIPLDMSWENIAADHQAQRDGEEPMVMKTKALALIERAVTATTKEPEVTSILEMALPEPDFDEIKSYLFFALGYEVEDILKMEHHDVDPDFLAKLKAAKFAR